VAKRLIGSGCRWGGEWVGRGMGVLDRVEIVEGEGQFWGVNAGHPIVTN